MRTMGMVFMVAVVLAAALENAPAQATGQQWQWMQRTFSGGVAQNPSARVYGDAVFDAARGTVFHFGGHYYWKEGWPYNTEHWVSYNDSWERDVCAWLPIAAGTTIPEKRRAHAMAYDPDRKVVVLFGGDNLNSTGSPANKPLNDTWEWDGTQWKNVTPPTPALSPSARAFHRVVYDTRRKRVVLFGGWDGITQLSDTWEWDGKAWTQIQLPLNPQARHAHAMAFNEANGVVVLFGGCDVNQKSLWDNWKYDGRSWAPVYVGTRPPKRHATKMVYDPGRKTCILHGGWDNDNQKYLSDTWEWDGATNAWTELIPSPLPSPHPSARYGHSLVFDRAIHKVVLFGGYDGSYRNDTWVLTENPFPSSCAPAGTGHGGGGLALEILTLPKPGTTLQVTFQNSPHWVAPGGFNLLVFGFQLAPAAILNAPVVVNTGYLHVLPLGPALQLTGNPVVFGLPIPNNPYLKGAKFCLQGGSFEATTSFRLTDAIEVTIQ